MTSIGAIDFSQILVLLTAFVTTISIGIAVYKQYRAKGLQAAIDLLNAYLTPGDKTVALPPPELTPNAYLMTAETKNAILENIPYDHRQRISHEIEAAEESGIVTYTLVAGNKWFKIDYGKIADFAELTEENSAASNLTPEPEKPAAQFRRMADHTKTEILDTIDHEYITKIQNDIVLAESRQLPEYELEAGDIWFEIVSGEIDRWGRRDVTKWEDVILTAAYVGSADTSRVGYPENLNLRRDDGICINVEHGNLCRFFIKVKEGNSRTTVVQRILKQDNCTEEGVYVYHIDAPRINGWALGNYTLTISVESEASDLGIVYGSVGIPINVTLPDV